MSNYFVTGIGTGIGKTLISAILTEKLQADYWKPIQAGDLDQSDSITVKRLISNTKTTFYPERYALSYPASPHYAAQIDNIKIQLGEIHLPKTNNTLIIEGAGGLMVPINENELILDVIKHLQAEVILISQHYLGSINHTLLTANVLKQHHVKIKGIIFNGPENAESQRYIIQYTNLKCLGHVPQLKLINQETVHLAGGYIDFD